jgi:aryl carrier-like protein
MAAAPLEKRRSLLLAFIRSQVASVIGLPVGQSVPDKQPLRDIGLDSLMAIELRNRLRAGLEIERALPATLVFDHPTVAALTDYLATEILGWVSPPVARAPERSANALELIEQMSDADVDKLLSQRAGRAT